MSDDSKKKRPCPVCGAGELVAEKLTQTTNYQIREHQTLSVKSTDLPGDRCTQCGETFTGPEAARMKHANLCSALGLLTPDEIKALREKLHMTQEVFADLLGAGVASVSRWERGAKRQTAGYERLMRLLSGDHGLVDRVWAIKEEQGRAQQRARRKSSKTESREAEAGV